MGWSPSPNMDQAVWPRCHALSLDDITNHVGLWHDATRRSLDAGYEILEIHGAHGYLIHQFLSPLTNRRTDAYGGDRNKRMRFALEIAETVRAAWPSELPLFFRVSAVDGKGGVWDLEDTVELAKELKERGVDVIDCSSGGISGDTDMPPVQRVPGYHVPYAARVRQEAGIPTIAVGLITEASQAEAILAEGRADIVALARELLWNPQWPAQAAYELIGETAYSLLPAEYSNRLIRRAMVARMEVNQETAG